MNEQPTIPDEGEPIRWRSGAAKAPDAALQPGGHPAGIDGHDFASQLAYLAHAQRLGKIGSSRVDLRTGRSEWSDAIFAILGLDAAQAQAGMEAVLAVTHPDDRARLRELAEKNLLGLDVEPIEFRVSVNGGERWMYRVAEVLRDARGEPQSVVVTLQDVTDRKRAEIELQSSRQHLAHAQRLGRIGSAQVDLRTGATQWSAELYALFGLGSTAAEPSFATFLTLLPPEAHAAARQRRAIEMSGGATEPHAFRIVRPDGQARWLHRQVEILRDEAGQPVTLISTFQDITEQRAAAEELRRYRDHLELAQRVGHSGSIEVDIATGKAIWTMGMFHLLGFEPGGPTSFLRFQSAFHPDDRDWFVADRQALERGEARPPSEHRVILPSGEMRWLLRHVEVIRDASGAPVRHISTFVDITVQKQAALALEERGQRLLDQQRHLSFAQRTAGMGSSEVDLDTQTLHWSEEHYRLFEIDPRLPPSPDLILAMAHPDDRAAIRETNRRNRAGEDVPPLEFRIIRADGSIRWLVRVAEVMRDAQGIGRRVIITTQDITERKRYEQDLLRSREHLAQVQHIARIGSAEIDLRTQEAFWSDENYRLLGLDPARYAANLENALAVTHPDDRARLREVCLRSNAGQEVEPCEFRVVLPDGGIRWLQRSAYLKRDADGRAVTVVVTNFDITERKRHEQELRAAADNLRLAQRVGQVGSMTIDLPSRRVEWSDEIYAILGLDPATTRPESETYLAAVHPEDSEAARRTWEEKVLAGLAVEPVERRIIGADGEVRWLHVRADVVERRDGRAIKSVITLQDVTERKRAEAQRDEFQRQLTQAQKMEAVGKLAGGVAHDFNNLLTVIVGRLEMLSDELAERPELKEWIATCIGAATRGASLTRGLLAISREQALKPERIEVRAAIRDVIDLLPRTLGETVEVRAEFAPDLWACEADPARLQNALLNLALNARDAMPEGGKIIIEARNAQLDADYAARNAGVAPGDYVVLSVTDTGSGMPPEILARAFDPFFTTKQAGKGTGLGLSMVYSFARQSGGHAKIYSEVGHGTTVRIYLPRSRDDVAREDAPTAAAAPSPAPETRATILVVEDDADLRELMVAQIERLGHAVLAAGDGAEALRHIEDHPAIDLLLTDLTLPGGMDGRRLARMASGLAPTIRVLYMSGYSENAVIHQGRLDAGVRLLQKPFTIQQLAAELAQALR